MQAADRDEEFISFFMYRSRLQMWRSGAKRLPSIVISL